MKHLEVYFSFAMNCDIEPEYLLNRISFEWGEMKGRRLKIKDLPYFLSEIHFHKHSWVYVDASITFEAGDKHMEFTKTIGKIIFNAKKVDEHFIINSCKEGGKNLS